MRTEVLAILNSTVSNDTINLINGNLKRTLIEDLDKMRDNENDSHAKKPYRDAIEKLGNHDTANVKTVKPENRDIFTNLIARAAEKDNNFSKNMVLLGNSMDTYEINIMSKCC
jgi:hypothetical protein